MFRKNDIFSDQNKKKTLKKCYEKMTWNMNLLKIDKTLNCLNIECCPKQFQKELVYFILKIFR